MLPPRALWVSIVIALVFSFVLIFQPAIAQTPDGSATVSGVVVDEVSGMPVARIIVAVYLPGQYNSPYRTGFTDTSGRYTIEDIAAGSYAICVEDRWGDVSWHVDECYNEKPFQSSDVDSFSIGESQSLEINFDMARAPVVQGKVTVALTGGPLADAEVLAYDLDGKAVSSATTDESGYYSLSRGLKTGPYKLRFKHYPGENWHGLRTEFYDDKLRFDDAEPIALLNGNTRTLNAALELGTVIYGTVTSEDTKGPLAYVTVRLFDHRGELVDETYTDGLGGYRLVGLYTGQYRVSFDLNMALDAGTEFFSEYYDEQTSLERATPIGVIAGQAPTQIDVQLEPQKIVRSVATSPNIPNAIAVSFTNSFSPVFSLDGGVHWDKFPLRPWIDDPWLGYFPDLLSVGISSRQEVTRPVRFMVLRAEGGDAGLYRTGDDGTAWSKESILPCRGGYVLPPGEIKVGTQSDTKLFVALVCWAWQSPILSKTGSESYDNSEEIMVSTNNGMTWQNLRRGIDVVVQGAASDRVWVRSRLYDTSLRPRWFFSDDLMSWTETNFDMDLLLPDEVAAERLYGLSWEPNNDTSPKTLIGIATMDAGVTWVDIQVPCASMSRDDPTLVSIPGHSGVLMMNCVAEGIVKRSYDGGASWETLPDITDAHYLTVDRRQEGSVFVGKADGLWLSTDIGDHWTRLIAFPTEKWQPSIYLPLPLIKR